MIDYPEILLKVELISEDYCRTVNGQACEIHSSFSASAGICMCQLVGGTLKVPRSKCCSSVAEYLKTGCLGTPDPVKFSRVIIQPIILHVDCNVVFDIFLGKAYLFYALG